MKFLRFIFVTFLISTMFGCASVDMASADKDAQAKKFTAVADKASLYIYRNETLGAAIKKSVTLDSKDIGETASKTYFYKQLAPGKHTIVSKGENTDTLTLDMIAGKIYYVWQEVKMGFLTPRTKLSEVDEKTGKAGVLESKMIVDK